MEELILILGRLLAVFVYRGLITEQDKQFICGNITEEEWTNSAK